MARYRGLFPHTESVKMLCETVGVLRKDSFGTKVLLRCHQTLVERGQVSGAKTDKHSSMLPALVVADITDVRGSAELERRARLRSILQTLVHSSAPTRSSDGVGGSPMFNQQFGIRMPSLLIQGLSLGWLANDAAKPTSGLSISQWIPGGLLLDVLLARGEYSEFSVARWTCQLALALRWLHNAFHGRVHGRVDFDHIYAARRTSTLPDLVLTGIEPAEDWDAPRSCFTGEEPSAVSIGYFFIE